ncbi:MAG TPA: TonB-dependent receptor, partial [Novosphingobium sp.]|nr:TonB-dependent receptor [Novosphingobium sp.]
PPQRYEGRWNVSIYHTVQLVDRVQLTDGGAVLDLLNGDSLTSTGVARHSLEIDAGTFFKGIGLRMNGTWSAPTRVNGSSNGTGDLRFGALFKLNARLFVDLGQQARLTKASDFFKGARLSLMANNLFNQRQKVTDATGATPTAYQPYVLDPTGRLIGLELRKMF